MSISEHFLHSFEKAVVDFTLEIQPVGRRVATDLVNLDLRFFLADFHSVRIVVGEIFTVVLKFDSFPGFVSDIIDIVFMVYGMSVHASVTRRAATVIVGERSSSFKVSVLLLTTTIAAAIGAVIGAGEAGAAITSIVKAARDPRFVVEEGSCRSFLVYKRRGLE